MNYIQKAIDRVTAWKLRWVLPVSTAVILTSLWLKLTPLFAESFKKSFSSVAQLLLFFFVCTALMHGVALVLKGRGRWVDLLKVDLVLISALLLITLPLKGGRGDPILLWFGFIGIVLIYRGVYGFSFLKSLGSTLLVICAWSLLTGVIQNYGYSESRRHLESLEAIPASNLEQVSTLRESDPVDVFVLKGGEKIRVLENVPLYNAGRPVALGRRPHAERIVRWVMFELSDYDKGRMKRFRDDPNTQFSVEPHAK